VRQTGSATPRVLLAGLIIVGAGAAGFIAYRNAQLQDAPKLEPVAATSETEPEVGPPAATAAPARSIPDTLPDVTLANLDGEPTRLATFAGRPLLVNFWATWCAPCRREIPLLNKIRMERRAQNVEIVGIAVDFKDKVVEFTKETRIDYPLLMGEEDGLAAADAFGVGMGFPSSVFVDSQNRILTVKIGELHEDEANFAFDRLRDIDTGALSREAAQAQVAEAFREMATRRAKSEAAAGASPAN
jgi:thiol-disulfide isomerase/thioredoxin